MRNITLKINQEICSHNKIKETGGFELEQKSIIPRYKITSDLGIFPM